MATYVIGDIQGCYEPLRRLLKQLDFDPANDSLWFAGDLVSRGQNSLQTLRFIKSLGNNAISILGNHDISLLASAFGVFEPHKSLRELLNAPDAGELLDWLQQRPLLHYDQTLNTVMVHAGIPPAWTLEVAQQCADDIAIQLQQDNPADWLTAIYGNDPAFWDEQQPPQGIARERYGVNALTRMRYCYPDGSLEFKQKLGPTAVQKTDHELIPWFSHPQRKKIDATICFGHWSTLGYYQGNGVIALDTGCVWGGELSAVRIDHREKSKYQVVCAEYGR